MKIFDFFRTEKRADSSYTDALVAAITANAGGQTTAFPTATSSLEACAGLVGRAFASAEVIGPDYAMDALSPDVMALIGRSLIRRGEILFDIDVINGMLRLTPAASHDVNGYPYKSSWTYRLNLAGPQLQITRDNVSADRVIHIMYASDPETPWRGQGPLQVAQLAGRLSAETSAALADISSGPRGSFLPMPGTDGKDATLDLLKGDIKRASGSMLTVESMSAAWKDGTAPPADWVQKRFGPSPDEGLIKLMDRASREVYAACGLNPGLFTTEGETATREAWRQALFGVIQPLGKLVQAELRNKLDAPDLALGWSELRASDLQARARSFKSMVDGGMDVTKAAALSGLLLDEE